MRKLVVLAAAAIVLLTSVIVGLVISEHNEAARKRLAEQIAKAMLDEQEARQRQRDRQQLEDDRRYLERERKAREEREAEGKRHADDLVAASKAALDKEIADYEAIRFTEETYARLCKTDCVISQVPFTPDQLAFCVKLFRKADDAGKRRLVEQREADIQRICEKNGEEYRAAGLIRGKLLP